MFESAQSSNLTGTIQRSSGIAAAVVGNVYQPNSITLVAGRFVTVVKKVVGSATGSYPFEFQLQAAQARRCYLRYRRYLFRFRCGRQRQSCHEEDVDVSDFG